MITMAFGTMELWKMLLFHKKWIRCSKCQASGHISTVCPNKRAITIDQIRRWRKEDTMFPIVQSAKDIVQDTMVEAEEVTQTPIPSNNQNVVVKAISSIPQEIEERTQGSVLESSNTDDEVLGTIQLLDSLVAASLVLESQNKEEHIPPENPIVFTNMHDI